MGSIPPEVIDCPLCGHDLPSSDELRLDAATGTLVIGSKVTHLSPSEAWVLELLKATYPKPATDARIMEYLYRPGGEPDARIIPQWISRLRRHLRGSGWGIVNTNTAGYRLVRSNPPPEI